MESSTEKPIEFFKNFFLYDGFEKLKEKFVQFCYNEKKKRPNLVHLFETENDFIMHRTISNGFDDGTEDDKDSLTDTLRKQLNYQVKLSRDFIDKAILQYLDKHNDADKFLKFQERQITEIIERSENFFIEYPFTKPYVDSILQYIRKSYLVEKQSVDNKTKPQKLPIQTLQDNEVIEYSLFAANNIKMSFLKWLYERFTENFIIEELEDYYLGEEQFIAIFSSPHPDQLNYRIQFKINNIEVVCIIEALQPFFKNLNETTIDKSKSFINSKAKLLNRNDLYQASLKLKNGKKSNKVKIKNDVLVMIREIQTYQSSVK